MSEWIGDWFNIPRPVRFSCWNDDLYVQDDSSRHSLRNKTSLYAPAGGKVSQNQTSGFPYPHSIVQDIPRGLRKGYQNQSSRTSKRICIICIRTTHNILERGDREQRSRLQNDFLLGYSCFLIWPERKDERGLSTSPERDEHTLESQTVSSLEDERNTNL